MPFPTTMLLIVGATLHVIAYATLAPLAAAAIFAVGGVALLRLPLFADPDERSVFWLMFGAGWVAAGVAAIYATKLNDPFQTSSDAAHFVALVTREARGVSVEDLQVITEGAGAVVLWRGVYDFFAAIGFEREAYIGILVNIFAVSLSASLTVKVATATYGLSRERNQLLKILCSLCGLFWLFSAVHLRDAVVLLGITAQTYTFVRYIQRKSAGNLVILATSFVVGIAFFGLLRTEFLFVPPAMLLAMMLSLLVSGTDRRKKPSRNAIMVVTVLVGLLGLLIAYLQFQDSFLGTLMRAYEGYASESAEGSAADSLGMAAIVNQPFPIRVLFGSAYLFIFPIPFWGGLESGSVYHLFKTANVLFFYGFAPLLGTSLVSLARDRSLRTPQTMFLLTLVVGFTAAIAMTSLENRHFAAFFGPLFALSVAADMTDAGVRRRYSSLLLAFLLAMLSIHVAWLVLKL